MESVTVQQHPNEAKTTSDGPTQVASQTIQLTQRSVHPLPFTKIHLNVKRILNQTFSLGNLGPPYVCVYVFLILVTSMILRETLHHQPKAFRVFANVFLAGITILEETLL